MDVAAAPADNGMRARSHGATTKDRGTVRSAGMSTNLARRLGLLRALAP